MRPFTKHRGIVATFDRANVDTDQIIPKQFLKSIRRTGFGESLFFDWRYLPDGKPNPDFELNAPRFKAATILVTRNNFGCGSSREHAVWAIQQYGFGVVVAPSQDRAGTHVPAFADIFRSNCGKNGLLAIELSESDIEKIFLSVQQSGTLEATVDLNGQKITLHSAKELSFSFEIDPALKRRLLNGLDEIGITLKEEAAISAFESRHNTQLKINIPT